MDFKALRAKFQDEELLQKLPKNKPAILEKPKAAPPPQSPTHHLPAGARPTLITSINQSLEGKTLFAPRVVFKEEKKESKMPLIQTNSKGKDKSEGKPKVGKDKTTKTSKGKLNDDSSDKKQKKENGKDKRFSLVLPAAQKESTAELVPASPPPKATTPKKSFLGFKKLSKRDSLEITADPILDTPSSDISGPAPLIPVPSEFDDTPPQPETSPPKALLLHTSSIPDSSATMEMSPPSIIPAIPSFCPPPSFIPDIPTPKVTLQSETPLHSTPAPPVSRPASQNEIIPSLRRAASTPPPSQTADSPLAVASAPSPSPLKPEFAAEAGIEAVKIAAVATPPSPVLKTSPIQQSPKTEHSISALSALERAADMSPGKRTLPGDLRIFSALEKARRKTTR